MTRITLTVDGIDVPFLSTIQLIQRDPYPGGHTYQLVVHEPGDKLLLDFAKAKDVAAYSSQQSILSLLEMLAGAEPGEPEIPARYILNSVDHVDTDEKRVVIEGTCSTPVATDEGGSE